MKKIRGFFEDIKADFNFRRAGDGHSLTETPAQPKKEPKKASKEEVPSSSQKPSQASMTAGVAAVERIERVQSAPSQGRNVTAHTTPSTAANTRVAKTSPQAVRLAGDAAVRRIEGDRSGAAAVFVSPLKGGSDRGTSVYLICPICQKSIPYKSTEDHLEACLQEEYLKDAILGSAKIIHTMCKDQEKRTTCVETLCRYLDNIRLNLEDEKYQKIRYHNKAFQDRVCSVKGGELFLEACGFKQKLLDQNGKEEQFYVLQLEEDKLNDETLSSYTELLKGVTPVRPSVDRRPQVFRATAKVSHFDLPEDFYHLTPEEIKKEQKMRSETMEKEMMLRTKIMKERDGVKNVLRYYRFILLRIRMPDNYILQGVFRPLERVYDVRQFVLASLSTEAFPFSLLSTGKVLDDDNTTLAELGLAPASVLTFAWTSTEMTPESPFLKQELLQNTEDL